MTLSFLLPLLILQQLRLAASQSPSPKRGFVYIESQDHGLEDDKTLLAAPNTVTWYYNYASKPAAAVSESDKNLEYVPMLWGDPNSDQDFLKEVRSLLDNDDISVKYVLGFNEPDMNKDVGGSNMSPDRAAEMWKKWIEPLKDDGLKLGAPAIASTPEGKKWLAKFMDECDDCTIDFIPLHWYGNFEGFAGYLGEMRKEYPKKPFWVTELGYAHAELDETYDFFNSSMDYLDKLDYVDRYAWFGTFRSDVSKVGPYGAMLDDDGELTDLGAWYLGRKATGHTPAGSSVTIAPNFKFLIFSLAVLVLVVST